MLSFFLKLSPSKKCYFFYNKILLVFREKFVHLNGKFNKNLLLLFLSHFYILFYIYLAIFIIYFYNLFIYFIIFNLFSWSI